MKYAVLLTLVLAHAIAQTAPDPSKPNAPAPGSIAGVIKDAGTGAPMEGVEVSAGPAGRQIQAQSDSSGHYILRGVSPGGVLVSIIVRGSAGRSIPIRMSRPILLGPAQELINIDFSVQNRGEISGTIVDDNDEPVPDLSVFLVARQYSLGVVRHVWAGSTTTNDQGVYTITGVPPQRGFLVLAAKRTFRLETISDVPANPQLRRPSFVPTYYPGSPSPEGAQAIVLRSGERKEAINLRVQRSPSFCVDGELAGAGGPSTSRIEVAEPEPTSGSSGDSSMFMMQPSVTPGPDGKFRVCDLHPGDYKLTAVQFASDNRTPIFFGHTPVSIAKEDVSRLGVAGLPHVQVTGQVVWDGKPPDQAIASQLMVDLRPITRSQFSGESLNIRVSIPGEFSFPDLLADDYAVTVRGLPKGIYLKTLLYGNHDLRYEPLRPGTAVGDNTLRVVLARDGGTVAVKVADKDGNPIGDQYVVILPASAASEAMLADAMLTNQTDQNGVWTSATLAPGKYYALLQADRVERSPETISRFWRTRSQAEVVEIAPNGSTSVTLVPKPD